VIPPSVTKTGQSLLNTGVVLETAFVEAYLGAVKTLSSTDLKVIAAKVAANEATHFSFFDAAAGAGPAANLGGHGVLPSLPKTDTIPNRSRRSSRSSADDPGMNAQSRPLSGAASFVIRAVAGRSDLRLDQAADGVQRAHHLLVGSVAARGGEEQRQARAVAVGIHLHPAVVLTRA